MCYYLVLLNYNLIFKLKTRISMKLNTDNMSLKHIKVGKSNLDLLI